MRMAPPAGRLLYLYVGSERFDRDFAYYRDVLEAEVVWRFEKFGAKVAALRVGEGPLLLLADHRPAPSCMPIWAVEDLDRASAELQARGWKPTGARFEVPDGPCLRFDDPSGNPFALLQPTRPNALEKAYADPSNDSALR
jgi:predicted enzyme related to lactoylglutathione lyase